MTFPKIVMISAVALFGLVGGIGLWKKIASNKEELSREIKEAMPTKEEAKIDKRPQVIVSPQAKAPAPAQAPKQEQKLLGPSVPLMVKEDFPNIDRIFQLFTNGPMKLPIVETVTYSTSVPWLKGRPAWIADYANFYSTSRHFIARSLNGKADYFTQKVSAGSRFNVFRKDKNINFYLLIDLSRCKMGNFIGPLVNN